MNNNTPSLRQTLYVPSFKWLIRVCTVLYFLSVLVAYSILSPLELISEHVILIGMLFFWADFDLIEPLHNWIVDRYNFVFSISRKDQLTYFNSPEYSIKRHNAYSRIITLYPTGHYVYVIKDVSASGYYKIGRTNNPASRLRRFGVALPFEIHIIAIINCEDEILLESSLHRQFSDKRINGEWFKLNGDDISWIVNHYGLSF